MTPNDLWTYDTPTVEGFYVNRSAGRLRLLNLELMGNSLVVDGGEFPSVRDWGGEWIGPLEGDVIIGW